jgi:hypothetical protein
MSRSRLLTISIILVVGITPILSDSFVTVATSSNTDDPEIPDSHVIQGVPYIAQENNRMCSYCCDLMCFQYHGVDTDLNELLYLSGAAYSSANNPLLKSRPKIPFKFTCFPGFWLGLMDYTFYASIYGVSIPTWRPENRLNDFKCWSEYWSKIKYYISNDIPLAAFVNPDAWPITKTFPNLSIPSFFSGGGHVIVIVGYNETNGTICCHEPAAMLFDKPEKAGYAWEDLTVFRKAVRSAGDYTYFIDAYEKTSEPLSKEMRFEVAHKRNIEKMKGNQSIYNEFSEAFRNYGINAIKSLKEEFLLLNNSIPLAFYCFKEIILQRLFDGGNGYRKLWDVSRTNYMVKHNVSQYLMENLDLSPICKYESELLENESKCWKDINLCVTELDEIHKNNGLLKSMKLSKPIINEIVSLIDNIISIEQAIIDGPF